MFFMVEATVKNEAVFVVRPAHETTPLAVVRYPRRWVDALPDEVRREAIMSFLKRKAELAQGKHSATSAEFETWVVDHPALGEYLTATTYPDGGQRQTATVLVFVEDGVVKGCLRDRDTDMSLWASSGSIQGVLEALDAALAEPNPAWRKNQSWGQKGAKKK